MNKGEKPINKLTPGSHLSFSFDFGDIFLYDIEYKKEDNEEEDFIFNDCYPNFLLILQKYENFIWPNLFFNINGNNINIYDFMNQTKNIDSYSYDINREIKSKILPYGVTVKYTNFGRSRRSRKRSRRRNIQKKCKSKCKLKY